MNVFAGYARAGDGSALGAAQNVYMTDPTQGKNFISIVPFAPADATCGQSYVADLIKHFARQVIKRVVLKFIPSSAGQSTSTSTAQIAMAPYRGGDFSVNTSTNTTANPYGRAAVAGMQDSLQFPSWLPSEIDFTKYIAGGSGSKQNEFDIANPVVITSATDLASTVPCGVVVSGDCSTAMNGNTLGTFVWEGVMDLLDFIGGLTQSNPTRVEWEKQWEERRRRDREVEELRKAGKGPDCRPLTICELCNRCSKHEVTPVEITTTGQMQTSSSAPAAGLGSLGSTPMRDGYYVVSASASPALTPAPVRRP